MSAMAFQIPSVAIVCSTIYSGADKRKHQTSASLAYARGIHRWPVNSPHQEPVTRKMFPFDDVIMLYNKDERVEAIRLFSLSCCRRTVTRCYIFGKLPGLLPSLASLSVLGIIFTYRLWLICEFSWLILLSRYPLWLISNSCCPWLYCEW